MQLFFSALTWYLERHPDRAEILLFGGRPSGCCSRPRGNETRRQGRRGSAGENAVRYSASPRPPVSASLPFYVFAADFPL